MNTHKENNQCDPGNDGPMILAHDEVEGYRPVFYVCIVVGMLYLAFVFWRTW